MAAAGGTDSGWGRAAELSASGAGLAALSRAGSQAGECGRPAESTLRLEIGRHSVAWDREGRWLVQVFDRSGGERLSRPLPRRGLGFSLSPGEGCQVVITRLPASNCVL